MSQIACFECGKPADHNHHVVPVSSGGTRTVPLCVSCHSKVHGRQLLHSELVKAGMQCKKERVAAGLDTWNIGRGVGINHKTTPEVREQIARMRAEKTTVAQIARDLNLSRQTVYTVLSQHVEGERRPEELPQLFSTSSPKLSQT